MNSLVADAAGLDLFLSYLNFPFVFLISLNIFRGAKVSIKWGAFFYYFFGPF